MTVKCLLKIIKKSEEKQLLMRTSYRLVFFTMHLIKSIGCVVR